MSDELMRPKAPNDEKASIHMKGEEVIEAAPFLSDNEPLVWVLSDGTAGMLSQSLALVLAMDVSYFDMRVFASPIYRLFPQMGAWPLMPVSPRRIDRKLGPPWPDVLINCGKRTAGAGLSIKRQSGGRTKMVQIQDPRIDPSLFDVMVVPAHDPISQRGEPHIVVSKGSLNRLKMDDITEAAEALSADITRPSGKVSAVMIGGNNRRYKPNLADFQALGQKLAAFASQEGRHLLLVGSRRTPRNAMAVLAGELGGISHQIWDGRGANPYPGVLGLADDIIVTSDSVNMVSEACLTGKPVYVAELQKEEGRIAAFLQMMQQDGHIKALGQAFEAPPVILDETPLMAQQVRKLLKL